MAHSVPEPKYSGFGPSHFRYNPAPHLPQEGPDHQARRKALLASLRGQTIRIPNLATLFQHWPTITNPHLDRMRVDINNWVETIFPPGKMLTALQASDFGLFGSTWWPSSPFPRLRIMTYLIVWFFIWDDKIDLSSGAMWDEFETAQLYRSQTLAYVRYMLEIDTTCPVITHDIILSFKPIGEAIRKRYTMEKRMMVYEEMRYFVEMSEQEQRARLLGGIPSLSEFWHWRLGTSAVTELLVLIEFSREDMDLPVDFYVDEDVREIFKCTNTLISACNDLVSIKKEIKHDAVDSLIPILYSSTGDIQAAVNEILTFLSAEVKGLDDAAERLFTRYASAAEKLQTHVRDFVEGCKTNVTGNVTWSLVTSRYGVHRADDGSGDIVMRL